MKLLVLIFVLCLVSCREETFHTVSGNPQASTEGQKGEIGPQGPIGPQGLTGIAGAKGSSGAKGDTGLQGISGLNGSNGAQGIQGIPGVAGPKGATGNTGPAGSNGTNGTNGKDGESFNSLVKFTRQSNLTSCDHGSGAVISSGLDENEDGILQDAEVLQTSYVCDGKCFTCSDDDDGCGKTKVYVCHKTCKGKYITLYLPSSSCSAHFGHGDVLGKCK